MPVILGALGLQDDDTSTIDEVGVTKVWNLTQRILASHSRTLDDTWDVFVEGITPSWRWRYYTTEGGYLQKRGGLGRDHARKMSGSYEVGLPLEEWGDEVAADDVTMAYMDIQQYDRHIEGVILRDYGTMRLEILRAIFNNTSWTYEDPRHASITVKPLANGDGDVYPPLWYTNASGANHNHYLVSNYLASAIDDTNNPFPTIRNELVHHYGVETISTDVVVFINSAQRAKTELLADFAEVPDSMVIPPWDTKIASSQTPMVPGEIIGRVDGVWVSLWDHIPSGYMFGYTPSMPKPLMRRRDALSVASRLPDGLVLQPGERDYPFISSKWRRRYGFGCTERLNGVVMQFKASGSYDVPAAYARA